MKRAKHTYCGSCGAKYTKFDWPRECKLCDSVAWRNPLPVVVMIIPVEDTKSVLLIRRNEQPFVGQLAFCGGMLEYGETWQDGVVREVKEEIGLDIPSSDVSLVGAESVNEDHGSYLILFSTCPPIKREQLSIFKPNNEVSELVVTNKSVELCFPSHTLYLKRYLE